MEQELIEQSEQEQVWLKVQVPGRLHHQIRLQAVKEGRTLKGFVTAHLSEYLEWKSKNP